MRKLVIILGLFGAVSASAATLYVYKTGQYSSAQLQHLQFTIWSTTNLAQPMSQWTNRGTITNQTWAIPAGQTKEFFRVSASGY